LASAFVDVKTMVWPSPP